MFKMNYWFILILIGILVITAGCSDYIPNRDIVVIKLMPDGSTEWTRIIDSGFNDFAGDIIETQDGGFVLSGLNGSGTYGPERPRVIKLSRKGSILMDRTLTESLGYREAILITRTHDGGFATISRDMELWRFDSDGKIRWNKTLSDQETGSLSESGWRMNEPSAITDTSDGGFAVFGSGMPAFPSNASDNRISCGGVMRLDSDGNILWTKWYDNYDINFITAINETPVKGRYIISVLGPLIKNLSISNCSAALWDQNGTIPQIKTVGTSDIGEPQFVSMNHNIYRLIYVNKSVLTGPSPVVPWEVQLDENLSLIKTRPLDTSYAVTWTRDGGFFSAGFPFMNKSSIYGTHSMDETRYGGRGWSKIHAVKYSNDYSNDTTREWDREIPEISISAIKKVLQTSDGGYVILGWRENK